MRALTRRDLTEGPIARHVLALALPAILSTLVHNLYGLNDVYFAQYTGLAGQTAVSNCLFVMIAVFGVIQLASIGTLTLVARRTGAGNEDGADRAARQGLLFALALSLVVVALGQISAPLVGRLMGMETEVADEAERYMRVLFLGMPALFLFPAIESVFRARGDARTPLFLHVVTVVANIGGNAFTVFVLEPSVLGLAAATVFSRVVGCGLGLALLRRGRIGLNLRRATGPYFDLRLWRRLVTVSAPIGARTLLFGVIYQVVSRITAAFGPEAQNGLGVGIRIEGMCFFILVGFGLAAGPLVGQNLGAGRPDRAARAAWTTVGMAMIPSLAFSLLFGLAPELFLHVFTDDPGTQRFGAEYLQIVSICFVFMALEVVLANAFVGAGHTLPPMLIDVPLTAVRIPLAWYFAHELAWGAEGIWWTITWTAIARGIGMVLCFLPGGWRRERPDLD